MEQVLDTSGSLEVGKTPDTSRVDAELLDALGQASQHLGSEQAWAIGLIFGQSGQEPLTIQEIAEQNGHTYGEVIWIINKARERLVPESSNGNGPNPIFERLDTALTDVIAGKRIEVQTQQEEEKVDDTEQEEVPDLVDDLNPPKDQELKPRRRRRREPEIDLQVPGVEAPKRTEQADYDPSISSLQTYMNQIGKVPLLTAAQEVQLAKRIERGDQRAKNEMVEANLRLVVSIANGYKYFGVPFLDLIQDGTLGAFRAAEKFDWRRGYKFSTYATWWITQAVQRSVGNNDRTIRLPIHIKERMLKYKYAHRDLTTKLNRDPTAQEISEATGLSLRHIGEVESVIDSGDVLSLEMEVYGRDGSVITLGELYDNGEAPVDEQVVTGITQAEINDSMEERLNALQLEILSRRFGARGFDRQTLEHIGFEFGMTRSEVRRIEREATLEMARPAEFREMLGSLALQHRFLVTRFNGIGNRAASISDLAEMYGMSEQEIKAELSAAYDHLEKMMSERELSGELRLVPLVSEQQTTLGIPDYKLDTSKRLNGEVSEYGRVTRNGLKQLINAMDSSDPKDIIKRALGIGTDAHTIDELAHHYGYTPGEVHQHYLSAVEQITLALDRGAVKEYKTLRELIDSLPTVFIKQPTARSVKPGYKKPKNMDEVESRVARGEEFHLGEMPIDYWHAPHGLMRFGEEALGDAF